MPFASQVRYDDDANEFMYLIFFTRPLRKPGTQNVPDCDIHALNEKCELRTMWRLGLTFGYQGIWAK